MNKLTVVIALFLTSTLFVACSGEKAFCRCIEEAEPDQIEFTGDCAYINEMSAEDFDTEVALCELEGFELLMK